MISGILLAAGQSRRFGGNKLVQPIAGGVPMVLAAAKSLLTALPDSLAVVPDASGPVTRLVQEAGMPVVICEDAHNGMAHSLIAGIRACPSGNDLLIALADMPYIRVDTYRQLITAHAAGRITLPVYQGIRGHPVVFSNRLREELLQLSGDQGGKAVIARNEVLVRETACADSGVLQDIDTPNELGNTAPP